MAAAAPSGLAPPTGQAAAEAQQVDMDVKGSADLEAEVAAMLSGMNKGAAEAPAQTDSAGAAGQQQSAVACLTLCCSGVW